MTSKIGSCSSTLNWNCNCHRSGLEQPHDTIVDVVDVAVNSLHTSLDRDTFVAGEGGQYGCIACRPRSPTDLPEVRDQVAAKAEERGQVVT